MTRRSMKRILVAVDGSKPSLEAVRYVGDVLPGDQTKVVLFHVLSRVPDTFWDAHKETWIGRRWMAFRLRMSRQEEMIEEFMERAAAFLHEAGYPPKQVMVRVQERHAGVARDIMREASKGYAALVVGRCGTSPLKGLSLGTTADKVVHHLPRIPIWVVGERPDARKILIAMDRSDRAMRTLDYVTSYLGLTNKELLLFHAVREGDAPKARTSRTSAPGKLMDWVERVRSETVRCEEEIMQALFDRRVRSLERLGVDASRIRTRIVTGAESRAGAVLAEAEKEGCGTIVLGRKGMSVVKEFLLGRVCSKVLDMGGKHAVWVV